MGIGKIEALKDELGKKDAVVSDSGYNIYPSKEEDGFFELVTKDGKKEVYSSQRGAEIGLKRHKDMHEAGFDDMDKYIDFKNKESRERDDKVNAEKKAIEDAKEKAKQDKRNTTNKDKDLYVNMDKLKALSPMNRERAMQLLEKQYRHKGEVVSLRDMIESGEYVEKSVRQIPKIEFNRIKYNRMNQKQQNEYDKKLAEKKTIYTISNSTGQYIEVPKMVYDALELKKEPKKEEKNRVQHRKNKKRR